MNKRILIKFVFISILALPGICLIYDAIGGYGALGVFLWSWAMNIQND